MKILITIYKLNISGSATSTLTLAKELVSRGYQVNIFCPIISDLSSEFSKSNIDLFSDFEDMKGQEFDLIIVQHSLTAVLVRKYFPDTPMIFISHGVLPNLEKVPEIDLGVDYYVAVSEEVKAHLESQNLVKKDNIFIIRNGIDTSYFLSKTVVNKELKSVLFLTHHRNLRVIRNIIKACKKQNLSLEIVGVKKRKIDIKPLIEKSDLVISLGRGILEAMSCQRLALVYDYNGGDGLVTPDNISEIKKNNFSGRRFSFDYEVDGLLKEFNKYDPRLGQGARFLVESEFSASIMVDRFELLFNRIKGNSARKSIIVSDEIVSRVKKKILSDKSDPAYFKRFYRFIKLVVISLFLKIFGN